MVSSRFLRVTLLALVLLAALSGVSAKELPQYVADSVDAQGTSMLEGTLAAVRMDGFAGPSPPTMEIESANEFAIRRDYQEITRAVAVRDDRQPSTSFHGELPAGLIITAEYRDIASLFIAPLDGEEAPRIQVQTRDSWSLQPASVGSVEQPGVFDEDRRDLLEADVRGSIRVPDYGGGRDILVQGSFVAIFYEWDIVSRETGEVIPSGETFGPIKPLPEGSQEYVGKGYFNQTYVTVHNGSMRLGVEDARWVDFYVREVEAAIHGTLNLREAIALGKSSSPANISYQGDVRVGVDTGVGQPLTVQMLPSEGTAEMKVETVDAIALDDGGLQSTAVSPDGGLPTAATVALAFLLAASVYVLLLWRSRARYQALMALMEAGRYSEFLRRSPSALRSRRYGARLAVMHAVALLKTGAQRKVLAFLEALKPASKPAPATEAYLQACALAQMGQKKAAAGRLAECLELDARYAQEVQANPWFQGIRPRRLSGQNVHEFPEGYT